MVQVAQEGFTGQVAQGVGSVEVAVTVLPTEGVPAEVATL